MARFKLLLEYEGTRYSGWQMQQNAKTIQGKLYEAAEKIFKGERTEIQGAGRTDAGVHALCQYAHLDARTMLAPEIIKYKFNDLIPPDINVLEVEKAEKNFHARYNALSRSYIYQISKRRTAFGKNFVWWIKDDLNVNKIRDAAGLFIGIHDFASFADQDPEEKSTKVMITDLQVKEFGGLILIRITGSHFLWKMVRRMVGVLTEIGRGNKIADDILFYLNNKSNEPAKFTAPPSGLFLEYISYKKNETLPDLTPILNLKDFPGGYRKK